MALSSLVSRSVLLKQGINTSKWVPQLSSMATIKSISPAEHKISKEGFWEKNERLQRPMSPHLTIYKFEMPAILSITHRATGIILASAMVGGAAGAVISSVPFPEMLEIVKGMHLGTPLLFAAKMAIAWPLTFHALNGARHLAWDMGYGFQMPDLYKTGWTVVGLSILLAGILASR